MATAALLALSACGGSGDSVNAVQATSKIGVILPDTASSARYESVDAPFLRQAFAAADISSDIRNANGDVIKFQTIADDMISSGVKVLIIDSIDKDSGGQVIAKATAAGIPVIDYDRFNPGGGAKYYVSFDNVAVGTAMGSGLVRCMRKLGKTSGDVVELNGSPDDNNASQFKQGYDKVIKAAGYTVTHSQPVAGWEVATAASLFATIDHESNSHFAGVAAANDGLAGAVVSRLKTDHLAGKVPVTGQDATDEGMQRLLEGTQCLTIYKAVKREAQAAATLAIALYQGHAAAANKFASGTTVDGDTKVKSVLLAPQTIYKKEIKDVIKDGYTTTANVCSTAKLKQLCRQNGIM